MPKIPSLLTKHPGNVERLETLIFSISASTKYTLSTHPIFFPFFVHFKFCQFSSSLFVNSLSPPVVYKLLPLGKI